MIYHFFLFTFSYKNSFVMKMMIDWIWNGVHMTFVGIVGKDVTVC